jgi:hypothetical protein
VQVSHLPQEISVFKYKIQGATEKLKNKPRPFFRPFGLSIFVDSFKIYLVTVQILQLIFLEIHFLMNFYNRITQLSLHYLRELGMLQDLATYYCLWLSCIGFTGIDDKGI